MKAITALIINIALILFWLPSYAQVGSNEKIPVNFLKEDFDVIRNTLESTQLGLYLYISKDSLDKVFDEMSNSIYEPMTSLEFYRKIAPINGILKNLHTVFWQSASYENGIETGQLRFPLDIHWLDGKMYVLRNNTNDQSIIPGSIITTINDESAGVVFERILKSTIRDGFNQTYPIARASRNFASYYEELTGSSKLFKIQLIDPNGTERKTEVDGLTATQIRDRRKEKYNGKYSQYGEDWEEWKIKKEAALKLEITDNIAIMTLRTFHTYTIEGNGQKYEEFIKDSFSRLITNKTTDLIIDLRNNHGGHDLVGMSLMSHLHDSVFYYYKSRKALVKPIGKFEKKGNIYEIVGKNAWVGKVEPAQQIYCGNVYVLMNGYSVSATGEFIGHLKDINRAIFIGEESGGNPVIFTGGQTLHVDLPHSHVTGIIPLHLNEMNVRLKNNGHGVMPDYEVKASIIEILNEKDKEMEFVINLISNNSAHPKRNK